MADQNKTAATAEQLPGGAIAKAFAVMRVLRKATGPLQLTVIAEQVGLAPSSLHAILAQLLEQDAVRRHDDKRYDLGPAAYHIGTAFARNARISRTVWFDLVTAANELGVTAVLAITWEDHHLILHTHRGGDINMSVPEGGRVPLDAGSWGKAYYASSGEAPPAELRRYTAGSITDRARFADELETTRRNGYGTDLAEFAEGVGGVCAAITSNDGYEGLASFVAPISRVEEVTLGAMGRRVAALASRASFTLGDQQRVPSFGYAEVM
jgi:DNA-binding IclR family transcriptional regulator